MTIHNVFYGGRSAPALKLEESDDLLVVRFKRPGDITRQPLSAKTRQSLDATQSTVLDYEAGVEVLRCDAPEGEVQKVRDDIRLRLKEENSVRFAGKVLKEGRIGEAFIYTENLFVQFQPGTPMTTCKEILQGEGLDIKSELQYATRAFFVEATEGTGTKVFAIAENLLSNPDILYCHPELIRPMGKKTVFSNQWHLARKQINGSDIDQHANVEAAWSLSQGEGTVIAIIDDGVDTDHEEFTGAGKIISPRDFTRRINSALPRRNDNHGTACAGVACANGYHGASGVAPKARLMPLRLRSVLGSQAEADAFHWAADKGADVISCSWGPSDGRWWDDNDPAHHSVVPLPDSTRLAIDYATNQGRNGKGCVITWAAGNGNESVDNDGYASYDQVIAVAACNDHGTRSAYSDKGSALWCAFPSNHGNPSLTDGIWTTDRSGVVGYNPGNQQEGDSEGHYTDNFGGTSSACPGVAGVAALVLSHNPDLHWDQVKDIIKESCDKIDQTNGAYSPAGHSSLYGYGRVNASNAVTLASPQSQANITYSVLHQITQDIAIKDHQEALIKLNIGETDVLKSIIVGVNIEHTYIGDLLIDLIPPDGSGLASVRLHNKKGAGSDDLQREYDQLSTPDLMNLINISPTGEWHLKVQDTETADSGKINSFHLSLGF